MDYFDQKNFEWFEFLNETFNLKKSKEWKDISQSITLLKVKLAYRKFAELFPKRIDYVDELKKSQLQFATIHYGTLKARTIIDEVVRFSLYSDKIIVFHPLQNPAITNPDINPGRNPKYWLQDFLDALYFYIVIQKWVKEGIIKLIINPYEYDLNLRDKMDLKIRERVNKLDQGKYFDANKDSVSEFMAEQFGVSMKGRKKEDIIDILMQMTSPVFTIEEAKEFSEKIIDAFPKVNPLFEHLTISLRGSNMVVTSKGGGPLESILLVSELTGGNIYTPRESTWMQIQEAGINEFWTKVSQSYSKVPLNFLDSVDTAFALELRKDDRLAGVRQEMKKIFGELRTIDIKNLNESKLREAHEGLTDALRRSEAEWSLITKQARTRNAILVSGVAIPLISKDFSWLPLTLSSLVGIYQSNSTTTHTRESFRIKNPVSVFVDLKHRPSGFMSLLKNCLI